MPTIYIDNQPYVVESEGRNLLDVCLSLGFNVPYFCWHPALRSVGACRQCAVKLFRDENDAKGRIVMSCMTAAIDGARISIDDAEVVDFRARVIEWLMTSHPHDCPVCDEGGECHLQDMTVMAGHVCRRYRFPKRTYRNQDLGPFVTHEMNRCIQCYRCVRFYRDYAGGRDLDVLGWHHHVYFGRHQDGPLESEFSGNLVEVCPTGVFTDKSLASHYTRKWDLQTAPSICVHCGQGCNTIPGERYGTIRRIHARFHRWVNGYFICDRGRYGYEFINHPQRLRQPMLRQAGKLEAADSATAMQHLKAVLGGRRVIGIGSSRASLESNFALYSLLGADRFFHGVRASQRALERRILEVLRTGPVPAASHYDLRHADAVLVLGEDVTNTAPMLDLAIRQAVFQRPVEQARKLRIHRWDEAAMREAIQDERGPLFIATPRRTKLDSEAAAAWRAAPDDIARLGFAVAHEICRDAPAVADLPPAVGQLAQRIAHELANSPRPTIVAGVSLGSGAIVDAAANVAWALIRAGRPAQLCYVQAECNSLGAAMFPGGSLDDAVAAAKSGQVDAVIVMENDLYRHMDAAAADALLSVPQVVVLDHLPTPTTRRASVVLPAATYAESDGTLVNHEGRAQRFFQVLAPPGQVQESWRWIGEMMVAGGNYLANPWQRLDSLLYVMADVMPELKEAAKAAPNADFRIDGQKVPRQPARYSGRTAMTAHLSVHEPKPPEDVDAPLSFSMEGAKAQPPAALIPRFWAPGWNSVGAINKFQIEVAGNLRGGEAGKRLIEPAKGQHPAFSQAVPPAFGKRTGELLVLPAYHVFGSEPLSMLSQSIAQRAPQPYAAVSQADAERLGLHQGQMVLLKLSEQTYRLPLLIEPQLAQGTAAMPAGLPSLSGLALPQWGTIRAESASADEPGGPA